MKIKISEYANSWQKRTFDVVVGAILLLLSLPIGGVIALLVLVTEGRPIFFVQKRVGKNGKIFEMCKFRTMRIGAESEQKEFKNLNEANGPVFKIRNDPRFVGIGKRLSHTGLDELPQLWNVVLGDMSLVGPRPLPVFEEKRLQKRYRTRNVLKPGIINTWVISGSHKLSFEKWMELDMGYARTASIKLDLQIIKKTTRMIFGMILE